MQKIHGEIRRVDAGILAAVRQQVILFAYCVFIFSSIDLSIMESRGYIPSFLPLWLVEVMILFCSFT